MGSPSAGSARDNTGPDQGFFISQSKKPSGLTKKNQEIVDSSFKDRGAVKIKNSKFKTPATAILSKPLQAGSKVTREFFTDKVLGSKNFKNTSKSDFLNMSISQQESIYGDYIGSRQSGKTDAYGNTLSGGNDNSNNNNNQPVIVQKNVGGKTVQTTESKVAEEKKEATEYDERQTKKKGRSKNILTSKQGIIKTSADYSLGKKSLLGQVV